MRCSRGLIAGIWLDIEHRKNEGKATTMFRTIKVSQFKGEAVQELFDPGSKLSAIEKYHIPQDFDPQVCSVMSINVQQDATI